MRRPVVHQIITSAPAIDRRPAAGAWPARTLAVLVFAAGLAAPIGAFGQTTSPTPGGASDSSGACDGLLALLDRPTVADSACVAKPGQLLAEIGFQDALIKGSNQRELAFGPQAELRYGLPMDWEIKLFPPSDNVAVPRDSAGGARLAGLDDIAFGTKHQFGTFGGFTVAADVKVTAPTGAPAFTDGGVEATVQAIVSYAVTKKLSLAFQMGGSSLTQLADSGRVERYATASPDVAVSYQLSDKLQLYSEVFGSPKSAPRQGGNVSFDGGIQYLLTKSIEVDTEAGVLLAGPQGQQARYFGFGTGVLF